MEREKEREWDINVQYKIVDRLTKTGERFLFPLKIENELLDIKPERRSVNDHAATVAVSELNWNWWIVTCLDLMKWIKLLFVWNSSAAADSIAAMALKNFFYFVPLNRRIDHWLKVIVNTCESFIKIIKFEWRNKNHLLINQNWSTHDWHSNLWSFYYYCSPNESGWVNQHQLKLLFRIITVGRPCFSS